MIEPNNWSVEKDPSGFTVKYDTNEMYQIYEDLCEILNEFVHKRIELLPKEEQLGVIDLLSETFRFEYPGVEDDE